MIEDFKNYTLQNKFKTGQGIVEERDILNDYLKYLKDNIHMGDKKIKVVIDPGNGVTSTIVKQVHEMFLILT